MQQQDNHEYPFLYQRQTCNQVQQNQQPNKKRQNCQPARYLQKTLYHLNPYTENQNNLSLNSGRIATKSNQIKQLIRNGRSASLQRTFKKSFTSFSHSTRNKTRDGLIRVRNIRALNGRFNTSITHAYSIVIGSKHITLNATGGGFLTASKQFRHGATSKSRSNTASNSTKHKSPHLSGWRQIISLIT